jgi:hypothetical protein
VKSRKFDWLVRVAIAVALATLVFVVWQKTRPSHFTVREIRTTTANDGALRVLFIGNSHTFVNNLPVAFAKLVEAKHPSRPLAITDVTMGGVTLADHLAEGTAARTIAGARWDYVVLQEQSNIPSVAPSQLEDSVRRFAPLIEAAHARTVLYELWPHENASPAFDAYDSAARAVNAIVVRAGEAWMRALSRDRTLVLYQSDGYHPAPAGTYITACVFYATLIGERPDGLPTAGLVSPEVAATLQRSATP